MNRRTGHGRSWDRISDEPTFNLRVASLPRNDPQNRKCRIINLNPSNLRGVRRPLLRGTSALLFLVGLCPGTLRAQEEAPDLRWKLTGGETLTYRHLIEQNFHFNSEESSFKYHQKIEATEKLEVERMTLEGNFVIRYSITYLKVIVDGQVMFDSDDPQKGDPSAAPLFRDVLEKPATFVMTPLGQPVNGTPNEGKKKLAQNFMSSIGPGEETEEALPLAVVTVPLPTPEELSQGKWEIAASEENETGTTILSLTTYRMGTRDANRQPLLAVTELQIKDAPATMKLVEGRGKQNASFDLEQGALKQSHLDFSVCVENEVEGKLLKVTNQMTATTELAERKVQ